MDFIFCIGVQKDEKIKSFCSEIQKVEGVVVKIKNNNLNSC